MRLADLKPHLTGDLASGVVDFECPLGHAHRISVPVGAYGDGQGWAATGEFPATLTLTPSIHAISAHPHDLADPGNRDCGWHGWVRDGAIINA